MPIKSFDPRITRLGIEYDADQFQQPKEMDQLETYEIFTEVREGKGYQHCGIMHGADINLAFLEAKEQYGRRGKCYGLWTVKTSDMTVSNYAAEIGGSVFNVIEDHPNQGSVESYDVFLQKKRGAEHKFLGSVQASNASSAFSEAKIEFGDSNKGSNLWTAKTSDILKTTEEDKIMFATAPEKHYREALIYKIKDKINEYRTQNNID